MNKTLIRNKEEFDSFERSYTGYDRGYGMVSSWLDKPEKYPCVTVWIIEYNADVAGILRGYHVYLDDFNED